MKKCKFCRGTGEIIQEGKAYYVKCTQCGTRSFYADTKKKAIAMWNKMMDDNK